MLWLTFLNEKVSVWDTWYSDNKNLIKKSEWTAKRLEDRMGYRLREMKERYQKKNKDATEEELNALQVDKGLVEKEVYEEMAVNILTRKVIAHSDCRDRWLPKRIGDTDIQAMVCPAAVITTFCFDHYTCRLLHDVIDSVGEGTFRSEHEQPVPPTTTQSLLPVYGAYHPFESQPNASVRDPYFVKKAFLEPLEYFLAYFKRERAGIYKNTVKYIPAIFRNFPSGTTNDFLHRRMPWTKMKNRLNLILAKEWLEVIHYVGYRFPCTDKLKKGFKPLYKALQYIPEKTEANCSVSTDLHVLAEVSSKISTDQS